MSKSILFMTTMAVIIFAMCDDAAAEKIDCSSAGLSADQINGAYSFVILALDTRNSRVSEKDLMLKPVQHECLVSNSLLPTISFYPNARFSECAFTENCTEDAATYLAAATLTRDWIQSTVMQYNGVNALRICMKNGDLFEGFCQQR